MSGLPPLVLTMTRGGGCPLCSVTISRKFWQLAPSSWFSAFFSHSWTQKGRLALLRCTLPLHLSSMRQWGVLQSGDLLFQFIKGAYLLRTGRTLRAPLWDLPFPDSSSTQASYEPMEQSNLSHKFLSHKTALILALYSAKRVSELHALSVSEKYLRWKADRGVSLWLNPSFLPEVVNPQTVSQEVEISAFLLHPALQQGEVGLLTLCPVRVPRAYIASTQSLRCSHSELFVCFNNKKLGLPVSKQCLSHWIANTISEAYSRQNLPVLGTLVAHSIRSVASSWATLKGVVFQKSLQQQHGVLLF